MFAVVASVVAMAQGSDDFSTITPNNSYKSGTSAGGWAYENAAIQNSGNSEIFGEAVAVCINGKTSAVGKITSPTIGGGIGTLTLNYAYIFGETKGVSFKVSILKDGTEVFSKDVVDASLAKSTVATETIEANISGNDLQIVITNNSPSNNSSSNKDRYSIWNISWTACTDGGEQIFVPTPKTNVGNGTYYEPQTITLTSSNTVYYYFEGEESKVYTEPITLSNAGTYTLYAYAQDEDNNKSDVISRTITIAEAQTFTSLADIRTACTATSESEAPVVRLILDGMRATYASSSSSYTFVSDGTDAFLIYGSQNKINTGDQLSGSLIGKLYIYNGTHELAFNDGMANVTATSDTTKLTPIEFSYDDFNYANDESKYFILKSVTLADSVLKSNQVTAYDAESNEVILQDRWNVLSKASLNKVDKFDVCAIATMYKNNVVYYVTSIQNVTNEYVEPVEPVEPYDAVGAGTLENPYTIEDVIGLYKSNTHTKDSVWVRGNIVGFINSNTGKTLVPNDTLEALPTNLSLGIIDGTENDTHISIQLPTETVAPGVRSSLNLKDNPQNLGIEVVLYGVIDKYCTIPGLKGISKFVVTAPTETLISEITKLIEKYLENNPDNNVTIDDIKVLIQKYVK